MRDATVMLQRRREDRIRRISRWLTEDKVRVRGSHLCGCPQGQDGPSAALGVEVEQGAAREADDKLGPVGER